MKKFIALMVFVLCSSLIFSACLPEDEGHLFTEREFQKADVYAHLYHNLYNETKEQYSEIDRYARKNNFWKITDDTARELTKVLAQVEMVEPFSEGETIDYQKGDPFLLLQNGDTRYVFYLYDADQFISVHSKHRYHPLLWMEKTVQKRDGSEEKQGWHCSLNAADYARVINLAFNTYEEFELVEIPMGFEKITLDYMQLFNGDGNLGEPLDREPVMMETETLEEEILLGSEIMLFENAMSWFYYGYDPEYCRNVDDEKTRSEIVRIAMSGRPYMPGVSFPEMILLGGDGEPSIVFYQETETGKIQHIISFKDGAEQLDEKYIYHDAPVISISKTIYEKENYYYHAVDSFSYRYILSPEDYRWLYELTQNPA